MRLFITSALIYLYSVSSGAQDPSELPTSQPSNALAGPSNATAVVDIIAAANSNSKAAVEAVLKSSDITSMNLQNQTSAAITVGIHGHSIEIVALLLDKTQIAIDQKTGADGLTFLMLAAMRGNNDIVEHLLEKGADPCLLSWTGQDAATMAKKAGHTTVVRTLQEAMGTDTCYHSKWQQDAKPKSSV